MLTTIAKNNFMGLIGQRSLNCAQSVIDAFNKTMYEIFELDDFSSCGGGRAPDGECGAFYACKIILGNCCPEKIPDLESYINDIAGSAKCREIRKAGNLKCIDCIEHCTKFIKEVI